MLDQVAAAFERQDYPTASALIKELLKRSPNDPWVQFYVGRLQEVSGKPKAAEEIYRKLLQLGANPKLVSQARQGLGRLGTVQREQQKQSQTAAGQSGLPQGLPPARTAARSRSRSAIAPIEVSQDSLGFMVLEAIAEADRAAAIQRFCQVMQIDAYTARGLLPSRGWRLYRTALATELDGWGEALQAADIPVFWATLADLDAINLFQVHYFQAGSPQAVAVCQNEADQVGAIAFNWAEVSARVEGVLPLFSPMVEVGYRDRLEWKESIADYAHFCDLHLPKRNSILRIHDGKYDFQRSTVAKSSQGTVRQHWNELKTWLNNQHSCAIASDFTRFADTTVDFAESLSHLKPHTCLPRAADYYLDAAFHLYSALTFLKSRSPHQTSSSA
jgi:hypothetical protein